MTDLRQTPQYAKYMGAIGWQVERSSGFFAYIKKIPLFGNFIKIQRPEKLEYQSIDSLAAKYKPFQIVVEPKSSYLIPLLTSCGFKLSKTYFVPSKTVQIVLTKKGEQSLKEMHYKTRYNIKLGKRLKLKVESSKDINSFADFWQVCALKQRGMFLSQKKEIVEIYKAFGKNSYIITVKKNKETLAAILLICTKDTAYYMYAASTNEGKKLFAPTLAAWESIRLAKKLKKKIFDFEGVYDERFPIKSWLGFTRFKKSFGGKEVEYPGTYRKFLLPLKL